MNDRKLFLVAYTQEDEKRKNAFYNACKEYNIEIVDVTMDNFLELKISTNDLFYRVTNGTNAQNIEKILVTKYRPKTLYKNNFPFIPIWTFDANIVHQSNNVPIAKTMFMNTDDEKYLESAVDNLNGFPIIIKVINKSKGEGVLKADNFDDLKKIVNELIKTNQNYILREYVDSPGVSYRSIVLGDKILISYKNESVNKSDFRSNADQSQRIRKQVDVQPDNALILINAVNMLNTSFGAIDYAFDKDNKVKIFEVNFPCNFIPAQELSGVNIAKEIISFLMENKHV